ncbi:MAG: type II toxin-antitoxin system VapC family toxin [Candidatus Omnitrophica bacterium]|nr:type II toxin-antitoxin system VapC family toxin [Candidatus Omnitrophota bacterium]MBU4477677.1 type II toxin-antitoxin system VapC family toxin [Candidatus Omnitrophota bacterium]MCG2703874.1 type II toxin-antitoxin system VapC family toxin [Candidatus Omnitrophota bacterium]
MKLSDLKKDEIVFIDANIFLYHFTGVSKDCRDFLKRCEAKELYGITGVTILAEVCHRLMIAEAIKNGYIQTSKPAVQLQKKPAVIEKLFEYSAQVMNIATWGIKVISPPEDIILSSQIYRTECGLLTNDSFIPVYMQIANTEKLASNDRAFSAVPSLQLYAPVDV